jgi:ribosomal protein S3AE
MARSQWLMPTILPTQEVEIRKIMVQSQPQANNLQDPISKKKKTFTKMG